MQWVVVSHQNDRHLETPSTGFFDYTKTLRVIDSLLEGNVVAFLDHGSVRLRIRKWYPDLNDISTASF